LFWPAAALMALSLWLHVRERHAHEHQHEGMVSSRTTTRTSIRP